MNREALSLIANELYNKYLIPFCIINDNNRIIFPPNIAHEERYLNNSYLNDYKENNIIFLEDNGFFFSNFECNLTLFKNCRILVGPCGILGTSISSYNFKKVDYLAGIHYSKETRQSFIQFTEFLYTFLNGTVPQPNDYKWAIHSDINNAHTNIHFENNLSSRRYDGSSLEYYDLEKKCIEAIKYNEPEKLKRLFKKMNDTYYVELSTNKIENLKYKCASLIAILTRVSINNGVPILQAYSLSDSLIQKLQQITSLQECLTHVKESSYFFIDMIHKFPHSDKNPLTKQILYYIDNHIYERITLYSLSRYTQRSPAYISSEFKKSMGQTLHSYILNQKISEAKHLLLFTSQSCKDIAMQLNFSSQSHFIQKFKKVENKTPIEFRNKYFSSFFE